MAFKRQSFMEAELQRMKCLKNEADHIKEISKNNVRIDSELYDELLVQILYYEQLLEEMDFKELEKKADELEEKIRYEIGG